MTTNVHQTPKMSTTPQQITRSSYEATIRRGIDSVPDSDIAGIKRELLHSPIFSDIRNPSELSIRKSRLSDKIGSENIPNPPGYRHINISTILYVVYGENVYYIIPKPQIDSEVPVQFIKIFHAMSASDHIESVVPSMGIDLAGVSVLTLLGYKIYKFDNFAAVISSTNQTITVFEKIPHSQSESDIYAGTR